MRDDSFLGLTSFPTRLIFLAAICGEKSSSQGPPTRNRPGTLSAMIIGRVVRSRF